MKRRHVVIASLAVVIAAATAGIGLAGRAAIDDAEQPISGTALEQASAAALASIGGGRVTDTEVGDEDAYYEVEVTLDGREIDVHLDRAFNVVSTDADADAPGDRDEASDD
jgi:uncharacterized membrane protein YkoI